MRDPVLDREMFRSTRKDVEEGGIAAVADAGDEGYNSRVEEAKRLFDQARVKQDPSRFQTLSEQEKPGVFRPIQAGATQMPQPNVQQQMAQMQAMGFRPVGMANGGYVKGYQEGGPVTPTVRAPYDFNTPSFVEYNNPNDLLTWTDDYMAAVAEKTAQENAASVPENYQSYVETDPKNILSELRMKRANLLRSPEARKNFKGDQALSEKKDSGDFADVSGDMDYRQRIREQEEAGIAALPDKRDFAGDREYARNVSEDAARREEARPDKRDFASERPYNQATAEREAGLASLPPTASDDATANAINARLKSGIKGVNASATGTTTGGATTPAAASGIAGTQAAADAVPEKQTTTLEGIKSERAKERAENINLSLIQAGLAMAAGTSSNAMTNIGQGGISGLKAFSEAETESRRAMREAEKFARQEAMSREEMAQRLGMSRDEMAQRERIAADERLAKREMFDVEQKRLNAQMLFEFEKTGVAQDIQKQDIELRRMVANNQISSAEADRIQKDNQFKQSLEFDKWKTEKGLAAPSDNMKLYSAIGGGDIKKGFDKVEESSLTNSKVNAYKAILGDPMAPEEDKVEARDALMSLFASPTPDTSGFTLRGVR